MKYKILISAPYMFYEKEKIERYLKDYNWEITWANVKERLEEDELLRYLPGHIGIICGDDQFSEKVYKSCKDLKIVVKWGTGIDSIKKEIAIQNGVQVYNTPGAFTVPVAETTIAYILSFARNVIPNDKIIKNGSWGKPQGFTISDKSVGIIGFGDIGQAVARRLFSFGCQIYVNDLNEIDPNIVTEFQLKVSTKEEIFSCCDFISLHTTLNPTTFKLLNLSSFKQMIKKPFIINTARGPIIDENDLIRALDENLISGAALDVFENEPLPIESPLRKSDKTILASHNSNSSTLHWDFVHKNCLKMMNEGLKNV